MAELGDKLSLLFQAIASTFWAVGAALAGPSGAADYLQFFAAVAWCVANLATAFAMFGGSLFGDRDKGSGGLKSSLRRLLSLSTDFDKSSANGEGEKIEVVA